MFIRATVDGPITVNCDIDREDLATIAGGLNELESSAKLSRNQMEYFLQATNTILGRILSKETSLATASTALKAQLTRVAHLQQEELSLLRDPLGSGNVTSSNQLGGVTAGQITNSTINQETQGASLSRYADKLQGFADQGRAILNAFCAPTMSDDTVHQLFNTWTAAVGSWLSQNMSPLASARFRDTATWLNRSYSCGGQAFSSAKNDASNSISAMVENLRAIEETTIYDKK